MQIGPEANNSIARDLRKVESGLNTLNDTLRRKMAQQLEMRSNSSINREPQVIVLDEQDPMTDRAMDTNRNLIESHKNAAQDRPDEKGTTFGPTGNGYE
jgi:hypothetical protein